MVGPARVLRPRRNATTVAFSARRLSSRQGASAARGPRLAVQAPSANGARRLRIRQTSTPWRADASPGASPRKKPCDVTRAARSHASTARTSVRIATVSRPLDDSPRISEMHPTGNPPFGSSPRLCGSPAATTRDATDGFAAGRTMPDCRSSTSRDPSLAGWMMQPIRNPNAITSWPLRR